MNRDQIMRGKNLCPRSRTERAKKGAANSPWSKGPVCTTHRAAQVFAQNRKSPNS